MADKRMHFRGSYLGIAERDNWEFATRTNAHAVAVLIAVTASNELVLVEQFRIPVQARVLELPAGLVGDSDNPRERIADAAARELEEETGFHATRLRRILSCPSTAGLSDEMVTFFLAEGLQRVGPGGGDGSEDIDTHLVPLEEIDRWLAARLAEGVELDPKVFTALYWLDRRQGMEMIASAGAGP